MCMLCGSGFPHGSSVLKGSLVASVEHFSAGNYSLWLHLVEGLEKFFRVQETWAEGYRDGLGSDR